MMKKFKGQSSLQFGLISGVILALLVGLWLQFGSTLSQSLNNKNTLKTFNAARTVHYENPKDLISNPPTVVDSPVANSVTPAESVLQQNINDGDYVQTSGSSGRAKDIVEKELPQITEKYISDINTLISTADTTSANYTALNNALIQYTQGGSPFAQFDTVTQSTGSNELKLKGAILNIVYKFNSDPTKAANLLNALNTYTSALPAHSPQKILLNLYVNDLVRIMPSISYSVDSALYGQVGAVQGDINDLITKLNAVTDPALISLYASEIHIIPTKSYSELFPDTYNTKVLCNGGSSLHVATGAGSGSSSYNPKDLRCFRQ